MENLIFGISAWWLVPISILAFLLTFWLYKGDAKIAHLSSMVKTLLGSLRFLAFVLIGILILGLVFERTKNEKDKPLIIFNIDDSKSMLNYADSNEVRLLPQKMANLKKQLGEKYDFVSLVSDSLSFLSDESNLSERYEEITKNYGGRNIGAVISVSDGNFNVGLDPVYSAEKIGFVPVYTIGVGDTVRKKDLFVQQVFSNKMAFLGNDFPVEVSLGQENAVNSKTKLRVSVDGSLKNTTEVSFDSTGVLKKVVVLKADKIGLRKIRVELIPIAGEFTESNNFYEIYVQIIDSRTNLTFISSGITPDAGVFKQVFNKDSRINYKSVLLEDFDFKKEKSQILVLHNLGSSSKAAQLRNWIQSNEINSIQIVGSQEDAAGVNLLNADIKIDQLNGQEAFLPSVNKDFKEFLISEATTKLFNEVPPLIGKNYKVRGFDKSKTICYQRVGSLTKNAPAIYLSKGLSNKSIVIFGEGIWRWRMFDYQRNKNTNSFDEFLAKLVQYLTTKKNNKRLQIDIPTNNASNSDTKVNAEFYNDAFELITEPEISFDIINEDGLRQEFMFTVFEKHYELNLGKLKGGKYKWEASTTFNGKKYEEEGEFLVEFKDLERLSTRSNFAVLRSISQNTKGTFFNYEDWDQLTLQLEADPNVKPVLYQEKEFKDLLDYIWLLLLVLGLLAAEWFIRKYSGTY